YELGAHATYHSINGVDGLNALSRLGFSGLSTDLSFAVLHRGPESPIGLTISVEPEWARVDGESGQLTRDFSPAFTLITAPELAPNRLYAAMNFLYTPEIGKAADDAAWRRSSTAGLTGALAYRIAPEITVGGELQYYRAYDGALLDT